MKLGENVRLVKIFKIGSFICVSHLVQNLLPKNTIKGFSKNFKAVFQLFPVLGSEKFQRHSKECSKYDRVRFEALSLAQHYSLLN